MSTNNPAAVSGNQDSTPTSEMEVLNADDTTTSDEVVSTEEKETTEDEKTEVETTETSEEPEEAEEEPDIEVSDTTTEDEDEVTTEEPTRLSWQLVKDKYPELAKNKDFRELYFRDKAFTDIFPTVSNAKEAAAKAEQLDVIDQVLVDGDVDTLFTSIDTKVLERISGKILPALFKINKDYFKAAARPIVVDMLHSIYDKARQSGDKNLEASVRNISRALTGNPELPSRTITAVDPQVEAERNKLKQDRKTLFQTQQKNFIDAADRAIGKKIEFFITDGLDPKKELNNFAKAAVIEKTLSDVRRSLALDEGFKAKIRQLHHLAARAYFPEEYKARIIAASLERAKKIIPVLRNKHRTAALGKQSTKGEINNPKKIVSTTEKVTTTPSRVTSARQIDMRKTSEEDFLNDKVVFRK